MLMRRRGQMAVLFGKLLELLGDLVVVMRDVLASGGHRACSVAFIVASKLSISLRLMSGFVLAFLKPFDQFLMIGRALRVSDQLDDAIILGGSHSARRIERYRRGDKCHTRTETPQSGPGLHSSTPLSSDGSLGIILKTSHGGAGTYSIQTVVLFSVGRVASGFHWCSAQK